MALETQIGPLSVPEYLLAQTIANATHFLTFTGEATVNDALGHIYYGALPIPASGKDAYTKTEFNTTYRPFCIVTSQPVNTLQMLRRATGSHYENGGTLVAYFERNTPSGTLEEVDRLWKNTVGKLLKQTTEPDPFVGILDQDDTDERLTINRCNINEIGRGDPDEVVTKDDYQFAVMTFDWGPLT